ncbi:hypothetical protein IKO50_03530 [bacterium]|nr:hypothetical protein [bacterium]
MDDVDFYLKVSETFSEIMRQVRFYPYPAVLYKIAFNKFLNGNGEVAPVKVEKKVEKKVEQISPNLSLSRGEKDHTDKESSSLIKKRDHEVVEDLKKSD